MILDPAPSAPDTQNLTLHGFWQCLTDPVPPNMHWGQSYLQQNRGLKPALLIFEYSPQG